MQNIVPPLDIGALHHEMADAIRHFNRLIQAVYFDYSVMDIEEWQGLTFPAVFIECNEIDPLEQQPGTGQMRVRLNFEIRLILAATPSAGLEARALALQLAHFLYLNQFSQPITLFKIDGIADERYRNNDGQRYHIMLIMAHCEATLGLDEKLALPDQHIKILEAIGQGVCPGEEIYNDAE